MQTLVPTGDHNPNGHVAATIRDALVGRYGSRWWTFRYELLDSAGALRLELDNVVSCSIDQDWLADIKRTARLIVRDTGVIDFLSDRIKPYAQLHIPPYGTDDWVEWPLGVFLLSSPKRTADETRAVHRQVDAYDLLQALADDAVTARYNVAAGTVYTTAVATLLSGYTTNITISTLTLPADKEWDPGTPKLKIINELLTAANYQSLCFDENGVAIVKPYVAPSSRAAEYTYADDDTSLIIPNVDQTLDLFGVPNQWVLAVSQPDRAALTSTYTNTNPASPTSTVRRGRTIVDFRQEQDAADQATLDALATRYAFEASQVYEVLEFSTGLNPLHSGNDVLWIRYQDLAVDAKYAEHSWSVDLEAGAAMQHRVRRVVSV